MRTVRPRVWRTHNWAMYRWAWSVQGSGTRYAWSYARARRRADLYVARLGMVAEWEVEVP